MVKRRFGAFPILTVFLFFSIFVQAPSFAQKVTKPEEFLGFQVGADYHLASYNQAYKYFEQLEQESPKIKLFELGKTEMGKPQLGAIITSAENMSKLDRYKEISKKLALAKNMTDEQALALAAEGKAVVYLDGGLHAAECAPAQHLIQLAYDLIASDDPDTRFVLDNTILLLVFANPDGMDMLADWYQAHIGTPFEVSPMPWVYNKYVGHDNNRDSYMVNMQETRNITRLVHKEWFPVVLYNHHQPGYGSTSSPVAGWRIWIPPNSEPTNPNVHPLLLRFQTLIGAAMGAAYDLEGKAGPISRITYDAWYPGYVTGSVDSHNVISILTEISHYPYATPHFYTLDDLSEEYRDFKPSVFYPNPWRGGWWRLRDAVEYALTGSKAVLQTAALYREKFLWGKYQMGRETISRFQKEPPYAWIIPQTQWDPPTAALMLNKLILLGIDVYSANEDFTCEGIAYPSRTWIIPMNQAFALFAKTLFEEQSYPDLLKYPALWQGVVRPQNFKGAYLPPYDVAGWTLPYQMGVKVVPANAPLEVSLSLLDRASPPAGKLEGGSGYAYLLSPQANNGFIAVNRILNKGGKVLRSKEAFSVQGKKYPPGTYLVLTGSVSASLMGSLAKELSISFIVAGSGLSVKTEALKAPKIGLYKSWTANLDEGWVRWLLEQYEFSFSSVFDADVKAGELNKKFDVMILPSLSTKAIVEGVKPGTIPPEYAGGISDAGVIHLKRFVESGGTLVNLNSSCLFPIEEFDLPVSDALKNEKSPEFICPGSLLNMRFDPAHPVAFGMPDQACGFFADSPAFNILSADKEKGPKIVGSYPDGKILQSGFLTGERLLRNKASVLDVPYGMGKIILLGFGVEQRGQPHGTFRLLFNSLYYSTSH